MARVWAISDLHVDYKDNLNFVNSWSYSKYRNDALIVAGDVTDSLPLLEATLRGLKAKFREVSFVTGNHELWIKSNDTSTDSYTKFYKIEALCSKLGVHVTPYKFHNDGQESVWIVPLNGWYAKPEDDAMDSLYVSPPSHVREDVRKFEELWMDNHLCKWPLTPDTETLAQSFTSMNEKFVSKSYDAPIISFSHFLPRKDLIKAEEFDLEEVKKFRVKNGLGDPPKFQGAPGFNFTRYAGCATLEKQIRRLGSVVHVFGHQHRNRDRVVDGIRYISHCLGNPRDQKEGWAYGLDKWKGPRQIWPQVV